MVFFSVLDNEFPDIIVEIIGCLFRSDIEVLLIEVGPEFMGKYVYLSLGLCSIYFKCGVVLDNEGEFCVSGAVEGAVVDVSWANECNFVIDDHNFAVHVDDLGDWRVVHDSVCPQWENEEIIFEHVLIF